MGCSSRHRRLRLAFGPQGTDASINNGWTPRRLVVAFLSRLAFRLSLRLTTSFIAFLPSRVHGSGSLTKYWAYDGDSFKVRGIEMRQHSTPVWIQRLQQAGLACLAAGERNDGIPSFGTQRAVLQHYRRELQRLSKGEIPLRELVITRRTSRSLGDYRVKNVTYAALMRANERGYEIPAGGRFAMWSWTVNLMLFWTASFLQKNWARSRLVFMRVLITTLNWPNVPSGRFSLRLVGPQRNCKTKVGNPRCWRSRLRMVQRKNPNR